MSVNVNIAMSKELKYYAIKSVCYFIPTTTPSVNRVQHFKFNGAIQKYFISVYAVTLHQNKA